MNHFRWRCWTCTEDEVSRNNRKSLFEICPSVFAYNQSGKKKKKKKKGCTNVAVQENLDITLLPHQSPRENSFHNSKSKGIPNHASHDTLLKASEITNAFTILLCCVVSMVSIFHILANRVKAVCGNRKIGEVLHHCLLFSFFHDLAQLASMFAFHNHHFNVFLLWYHSLKHSLIY